MGIQFLCAVFRQSRIRGADAELPRVDRVRAEVSRRRQSASGAARCRTIITWGVKYLVAEGIADPKRVGIMGGSYGGYATLAGVTFTPDLYAAAVDIVGPSNLITLLESIPPYWEAVRKVFALRMGDASTPEGKKRADGSDRR